MRLIKDRKTVGILLALVLMGLFVGISLWALNLLEGAAWYLFSSALRLAFGAGILFAGRKLYGRTAREILAFRGGKAAWAAAAGFLAYFAYFVFDVACGTGGITGLTGGLLFSHVILLQLTTGFYEELHYRFLIAEGYFFGERTARRRLLYALASAAVFGALHVVTGWSAYRFFLTAAIGFAFAVVYLRSRNIVLPMILHAAYDVIANLDRYIAWNGSALFETVNSLFWAAVGVMTAVSLVLLLREERTPGGGTEG